MEMEVDRYRLLDESTRKKKPFVTRVIERITLPEAVDDIGRRKEKFEKVLTVILVISVIVITIVSLLNTIKSYPSVSSAVKNETLETPVFTICSIDNVQPTTILYMKVSVYDIDQSGAILDCYYSVGENVTTCGDVIRFLNDNCIAIGGPYASWSITNTMIPTAYLTVQYLKPQASPLSELQFTVKLIHHSILHAILDPTSRKEFTLDIVRSGFIYSMGYVQERTDNLLRYPTTLLNLGPVRQDSLANTTQGVIYPFMFMLQLRSVLTTIIRHQSYEDAAFSFIASIGGLASTINTILSVFIGVVLTRICFNDRSAFFEHKTRLAATYFLHQQEQQNRLNSNL